MSSFIHQSLHLVQQGTAAVKLHMEKLGVTFEVIWEGLVASADINLLFFKIATFFIVHFPTSLFDGRETRDKNLY
jgi:hypothetical protein